jgi:hypothetical protein
MEMFIHSDEVASVESVRERRDAMHGFGDHRRLVAGMGIGSKQGIGGWHGWSYEVAGVGYVDG